MIEPVIHTENLSKTFRHVNALRRFNLEISAGAIYALVGPNGAGKTTALKILMNIFGPSSGRARILGVDSTQLRGRRFSAIGYVSENQEMPDWMRVDAFFSFLRPLYPAWDRDLERELRKQFDLPGDRKLGHLSRGMRMKAALASSLAYHPRLIVLDEPFTGLDPLVRDELIQGLLDRAGEATIVISSHDLAEVETFVSHVGYLESGELQFSEELSALMARFREVELTFASPPAVPKTVPRAWLQLSSSAAVVRFIDSRFDPVETEAQIRSALGEAQDLTFAPMSLRSIFLAMAKAGRGPA
jgi:ABC-2 type transport system ATP-binding protein